MSQNHRKFEEELNQAIEQTEEKNFVNKEPSKNYAQKLHNQNLVFKIIGDLIGGITIGFLFGFALDYFFGTKPLLAAIFTPFGVFIGVYNTVRYTLKQHRGKKNKKNN